MMLFIVLAQVAAASSALDFDLAKMGTPKRGCNADNTASGSEIVVCAKGHAETDIPITAMPVEQLLPKAEFKLFGQVRGKVTVEQGNVGPIPTNRATFTMSVPF
jgi:hypothetical protein